MEVIFPSLTSSEFVDAFADAVRQLDALGDLFDRHRVGDPGLDSASLSAETVATVEEIINRLNTLIERGMTLGAYVSAFVATDSRNDVAQAKLSELEQQAVRLGQLQTRFVAWL